ncbi:hypothetical protein [Methylobacterium radiotolerans]|uniref:hypothetical protein n=1 Tax=Methylobacterium radiotolerans TaxID=31998 RepID=UPI0015F4FFD7|nr:hypothetical protein [Methylobacterium radiotolerans]
MSDLSAEEAMRLLTRRYAASPDALIAVLCPLLVPIHTLDKTIRILPGQLHARATFTALLNEENRGVLVRGRTGKFVPAGYGSGDPGWKEIAKGRIINVDEEKGVAEGEIYLGFGGDERPLASAITELSNNDFLEIDQYGVSAKALSGLTEYYLVQKLKERGYNVYRMPEDMAAHLGSYMNFDFIVEKNGTKKRLEVKSLWGTNTKFARLIHSTTTKPKGDPSEWTAQQAANYYPTSSCKFSTQDFFAVSLFLKTGDIADLAYARSVPKDEQPHGLPRNRRYPDHVSQNPSCSIGDGTWFSTLDEVWDLA